MIKKLVLSVGSALLLTAITFVGCKDAEVVAEVPKGTDFSILYEMEANVTSKEGVHSVSSFTMSNNGRANLLKNWTIYFNAAASTVPPVFARRT